MMNIFLVRLHNLRLRGRRRNRDIQVGLVALIVAFMIVNTGCKAAGEEENVVITPKEVVGIVGFKDSNFIAIVIKKEKEKRKEYEIPFNIPTEVKISRKKSLDDIYRGDTVRVKYDEKSQQVEVKKDDGTTEVVTKILDRELKEIIFIKSATMQLYSGEEDGTDVRYRDVTECKYGLTTGTSAMEILERSD